MFTKTSKIGALVLIFFTGATVLAGAPRLTSSSGIAPAVTSHDGFSIAPAKGAIPRVYTEDSAPVQVFEIIRPDLRPFSVGRVLSSCACLSVSLDKADFGPGEQAFVEVRNVKPTQPDGATYAFFIEIDQPFRQILQYDVFVKSERRSPPPQAGNLPQIPSPEHPRQVQAAPVPPRDLGRPDTTTGR